MRTRTLGGTGIEVGEIGLGAWQLGEPKWDGPDGEAAVDLVQEALALGITFLDTAPPYARGRSEELLGEALVGRRREVVLCTKFGYTPDQQADFRAERIRSSVEGSLRRLRTDHLDVLLVHSPPDDVFEPEAPHYAELARLRRDGLVRAYGVSLRRDTGDELRRVFEIPGCEVVEVRFNALQQEPWTAIEEAGARGIGIVVKVPLESGWLSGRYDARSRFNGARARWTPEEIARRAELVDELRRLTPPGISPVHGALEFVLAHPAVCTVIPGARSIAQVRDNVAAASGQLDPDTLAAIRRWWEDRIRAAPVPW
jgi:aryl-alcohol dehydrogenase-like predicted oxidoreductase